jgi:hypothetical protein
MIYCTMKDKKATVTENPRNSITTIILNDWIQQQFDNFLFVPGLCNDTIGDSGGLIIPWVYKENNKLL